MGVAISKRLIIGVASICAVLFANILVSYYNISSHAEAERWIGHSMQVREALQELLVAMVEAETEEQSYVVSGSPRHLERFDKASARITPLQQTLKTLISDNVVQQQRLDILAAQIQNNLAWMRSVMDLRHAGDTGRSFDNLTVGQLLMEQLRTTHGEILREEDRLLGARSAVSSANLRGTIAVLIAFSLVSLLLTILIFYFLRRDSLVRRDAEQALRENERQYRRLFEEHSHPMWMYDVETLRFVAVNQAAVTHYGYAREEFLSMTLKDIRPREDVPRLMESVAQLSVSFDNVGTWRHCKKDGSVIDVEVTLQELLLNGRRTKMSLLNDVTQHKLHEEALHQANQMFRLVLDHVPQRIFWKSPDFRFLGCNRLFAQDAGLPSPDDLIGKTDYDMPWRARADSFRADDRFVLHADIPKLDYEEQQLRSNGSERWLRTSKIPLHDLEGKVIGILGTYEDVTERKQSEQRLRLQASAIESSVNGIFIVSATEADYPVEYVNPAFQTITGYSSDEVVGRNTRFLHNGDRQQEGLAAIRTALKEKRACHDVLLRNYRKDGSLFWNHLQIAPVRDEEGDVTHYVGILNDETERIRYMEQLERQANFDALTGLANRNLLGDRLTRAITHAGRYRLTVGVVLIDIDNFKFLNDSIGHDFGDALLNAIARRLQTLIREEDTLARYGGDEFVLVLNEYEGERTISSVVDKVLSGVAEPISLQGHEIRVTCSIGVSLYPQDGGDSETLLRHADMAMYRAKEAGRHTFQVFKSDMTQRIRERLSLEHAMHKAIELNEFRLEYQPQVDLKTGCIFGAEALIRWRHPEQGMISPARFIPIAEDSDLILVIGEWVMRSACAQGKAWRDAGLQPVVMSVNVSVRQFKQEDFAERVIRILEETGLAPECLELELTESVLMTHVEELLEVLDRLRAAGIRLAVDDFGTGYSSLNYLKRLPVDKLKIDRSFVRDIPDNQNDMAIAHAIIALARSMKLTVIAEGVETKEQLEFLRTSDCDEIQGYYFSKPIDPETFSRMLAERRTL